MTKNKKKSSFECHKLHVPLKLAITLGGTATVRLARSTGPPGTLKRTQGTLNRPPNSI